MTTAAEYDAHIKALLPPGPAWASDDVRSSIAMLIECWAMEFARVDARAQALIQEADPRFCSETFNEWLEQWGIPDECLEAWGSLLADGLTETTLRNALISKITTIGSSTPSFFIDLAKTWGYTVSIDELGATHTVMSNVMTPFTDGNEWSNIWRVHVYHDENSTVTWHNAMGTADEPLAWWGDSIIECIVKKYAPAHTQVLFGYFSE